MTVNLKDIVRLNRQKETTAESLFWKLCRNRKLEDLKFKRQFAIHFNMDGQNRFFVADFFCAQHKLIIEIDGNSHLKKEDYDELRTHLLRKLNFHVIRFSNNEITNNPTKIKEKINLFLKEKTNS